jgi:hypothetical protein
MRPPLYLGIVPYERKTGILAKRFLYKDGKIKGPQLGYLAAPVDSHQETGG